MKITAYDLALDFLKTVKDIDDNLDKKANATGKEEEVLDTKLDILETRMFELKNKLKSVKILN